MNRHRFQRDSAGKEESDGLSKIKKLKRLEYQDLGRESHFYKAKQLSGKSGEPSLYLFLNASIALVSLLLFTNYSKRFITKIRLVESM